jgi:hypothetical protein
MGEPRVSITPAQVILDMSSFLVLFGIFVVLGLRRPGRLGSTHVSLLIASAAMLGYVFLFKLGR